MIRPSPTRIAAIAAAWTIFGVLSAMQVYVRDLSGRPGVSIWSVFNIVMFYWAWALTTPLVLRMGGRLASDRRRWPARLAAGVPAAVVIMTLQSALYSLMLVIENGWPIGALPARTADTFVRHFAGNILTLGTIVAGIVMFRYNQAIQHRLVRAAELESSLTTARLDTLRAQLQPHFLFNTLNMISGLVAKGDARTANRAIARLSELLRASLVAPADQMVPLSQEMDLAHRYLEIAQLRFGARLTVHTHLAADAADVPVPTLILQPLIENALQHAVSTREKGGTVWVSAERRDGTLVLTVRDDGPGFQGEGSTAGTGLGLANTCARLSHLYAASARLLLSDSSTSGATVTVELPATR